MSGERRMPSSHKKWKSRGFSRNLSPQFGTALVSLMEWVEISEESLAEKALVSTKLVQRIRKNPAYPKNVDSVVAICIGINLPPELSNTLISRSGITVRLAQNETHLMYNFFLNHLYMSSIHECNDMLDVMCLKNDLRFCDSTEAGTQPKESTLNCRESTARYSGVRPAP